MKSTLADPPSPLISSPQMEDAAIAFAAACQDRLWPEKQP